MKSQNFFLIGGGPSAKYVDTKRFNGTVIGINDAAFHKPCDIFFSNDHGYALSIRAKIEGYKEAHLSIRQKFLHMFADWKINGCIWTRIDQINPSTKKCLLSSGPSGTPGCSGYVALNLAAQMGAKRIVLLGYDFMDEYTYFFDSNSHKRVNIPGVRKSFDDVAAWYAARGIEIFNANPLSAIGAFPKITHAEAYSL